MHYSDRLVTAMLMTIRSGWERTRTQFPTDKEFIMERVIPFCEDNDIAVTIAAGNEGLDFSRLHMTTPQSLGTPDNALMTIGGVAEDGRLWPQTTPQQPGEQGSITIYGAAANLYAANYLDDTGTRFVEGTSLAAPAIVRKTLPKFLSHTNIFRAPGGTRSDLFLESQLGWILAGWHCRSWYERIPSDHCIFAEKR